MSAQRTPPSGEDRLISRFFRPLARHPGALGLADDAAFLTPPPGHDLILTVDASVAGTHFFPDDPPAVVAKKAMRVNLSDLAAKGAKALGALLSLSIPESTTDEWLEKFARGLGEDCDAYDCPLLGGDTTKTGGAATISITAVGAVSSGRMVKRSGARPGDLLVVSGTIGDGTLGLMLREQPEHAAFAALRTEDREFLSGRYLLPQPRNAIAAALQAFASAAIDVSDGLAGDAAKLAGASGVAVRIDVVAVPLSAAARTVLKAVPGAIERVLSGGDDYEIVASVPPEKLEPFMTAAKAAEVPLTTIGRIEPGEGVNLVGPDGQPVRLKQASFSHF